MTSPTADIEDFARRLLRCVEELGRDEWVRYRDALERTLEAHPEHPCTAWLEAKPGRRMRLAAVAERIREAEFAHVVRRRASDRKGAPVHYRVAATGTAIELELPFAPPANHPLRLKRRWFEGETGAPSSRYADLTRPAPVSPWRRRLRLGRQSSGTSDAPATRRSGRSGSSLGATVERVLRQIRAAFSRA